MTDRVVLFQLDGTEIWLPRAVLEYAQDQRLWSPLVACYFVRRYGRVMNPLVSLVVSAFLSSFPMNVISLLQHSGLAVFEDSLMFPWLLAVWVVFNFSPFDFVFYISWALAPLVYLVNGYWTARNLTRVVDLATILWPKSVPAAVVCAMVVGAGHFLVMRCCPAVFGTRVRSPGVVLLATAAAALAYIFLTDINPISPTFWFDKGDMKIYVSLGMCAFSLLHWLVPDACFRAIWNGLGSVVGFFVPYYGSTWQIRRPVHARPAKHVPSKKVKTD